METSELPVKHSARVERILRKKEPQLVELSKKVLVMKGHHTSELINQVLRDLSMVQKPYSVNLSRKNEILPFEDANSIEFLSDKNDCALFTLGSHTKKRPNNLVMGRLYDGHILDMFEFGVESFTPIAEFTGSKKAVGAKPLFVFLGSQWESDSLYSRIQNFLVDYFRGAKLEKLSLQGIDHVVVVSLVEGKIRIRPYSIQFMKSGTKVPNVKLSGMGPFLDLSVRRHQLASDDLWKIALKQPKAAAEKKVKNISKSSMGDILGRLHMERQDFDKMGGKKMALLRTKKRSREDGEDGGISGPHRKEGKKSK